MKLAKGIEILILEKAGQFRGDRHDLETALGMGSAALERFWRRAVYQEKISRALLPGETRGKSK